MENKELKKKLNEILEKRSKCIQLTKEEEIFANEMYNKLATKKYGGKKFETATGEEIRKASDIENTPPPKNQQFRGGYNRQYDVVEREEATVDKTQGTGDPIREDNRHKTDNKEEKVPTEDNSGEIKGDYRKEEYADTDSKEYKPYYEEDRLSDQVQGQHQYKDSIRVKDIVIKTLRSGSKLVGQVLKVYPAVDGNQAAMVKWANGTFNHELLSTLEVLRPIEKAKEVKTVKEEDAKVSPPVKKEAPVQRSDFSKAEMPEKALNTCSNILKDAGFDEEEAANICKASWTELNLKQQTEKLDKGEKPPSEWLDNCVAAIERDNSDVDNPYAVCIASYNKMKMMKGDIDIVKLSPEDIGRYCLDCAIKMKKQGIKFLKVSVGNLQKYNK